MTANTRTSIQPKICAYCQQELVHQAGVGHLPHTHKPAVTNRAGEPYVVAWDDHYCALVFHPSDIEHYKILVSEGGNFTCRGKSDGSRCWPFYQQAHCVHCDAVEASIDCGERPALAQLEPTEKERRAAKLIALFDYERPLTPKEVQRSVMNEASLERATIDVAGQYPTGRRGRVKEAW